MSMEEARDREAFEAFYLSSKMRLEAVRERRNRELKTDDNPLIRPFKEDFANLNSGGKMLRGMLVNLGYRIAGGKNIEESDSLALAFELFQTAVLVHDDLIDKADLRRGKTTIHKRYEARLKERKIRMVAEGETEESLACSAALCAGDLGLFFANAEIADHYEGHPRVGTLIRYFDHVILDTIRGELLDVVLPYELQDPGLPEDQRQDLLQKSVFDIYRLKTAFYSVIGPLHLGMLLGDLPKGQMGQLDSLGDDLGVAFQIKDDLLGVYGDQAALGKDVGSDISEFKQTVLYLYVVTRAPEAVEELLRYYGRTNLGQADLKRVQDLFKTCGAYDYARDLMETCFSSANEKLETMHFLREGDRSILRGFISYLRGRQA
jgi:geranylgeranyl diphosphate synthase type I